ncbi:hypothetical protein NL676_014702 [Syzygium grande]|nr:hypothetical protein NL676_014702 [Syzygium grande]
MTQATHGLGLQPQPQLTFSNYRVSAVQSADWPRPTESRPASLGHFVEHRGINGNHPIFDLLRQRFGTRLAFKQRWGPGGMESSTSQRDSDSLEHQSSGGAKLAEAMLEDHPVSNLLASFSSSGVASGNKASTNMAARAIVCLVRRVCWAILLRAAEGTGKGMILLRKMVLFRRLSVSRCNAHGQ